MPTCPSCPWMQRWMPWRLLTRRSQLISRRQRPAAFARGTVARHLNAHVAPLAAAAPQPGNKRPVVVQPPSKRARLGEGETSTQGMRVPPPPPPPPAPKPAAGSFQESHGAGPVSPYSPSLPPPHYQGVLWVNGKKEPWFLPLRVTFLVISLFLVWRINVPLVF